MVNKIKYRSIFIICATLLLVFGCSRKKDKFLNKSFHSITTKYNYLYNGNNLLERALEDLNEQQKDNFWKLLPLEKYKPINNQEDSQNESPTDFSNAEENIPSLLALVRT